MSRKWHLTNKHSLRWGRWLRGVAERVRAKRGGSVRLAEHLGVSRQHVNRWLTGSTPMPPWAAVAVNVWWQKVAAEYPELSASVAPSCPPGWDHASASVAPSCPPGLHLVREVA